MLELLNFPVTTKFYDWRHYNPENAASFFATYGPGGR